MNHQRIAVAGACTFAGMTILEVFGPAGLLLFMSGYSAGALVQLFLWTNTPDGAIPRETPPTPLDDQET